MRASLLAVLLAACGSHHDDPPRITEFTVDPTDIAAGLTADVHVAVANFTLTEHQEFSTLHEGEETHAVTGPAGHVHVYLDDLETNPLLMMNGADDILTMPADTNPGAHVLIARLHGDDHAIVEPEVTAEVPIEVLAF